MNFTPASSASLIAFGIVNLAIIYMFLTGIHYSSRRLLENPLKATLKSAALLLVWLGIVYFVVGSGILEQHILPGIPLFIGSIVLVSSWFAFSRKGTQMSLAIPIAFLVGFHVFRLPLELILDLWVEQGTIPATMTWTGRNFDVATGVIALIIAPLTGRYRGLAWTFNIGGFLLLLNVIWVAMMSSPVSFGWGVQPPLQIAFHLPYAFIGPVCVGGAFAGHIILTRALLYH
ncbi:hypothetical protein [Bdellovibrio svalbardensis]|uniref:MFS transporter n=1 Tax=Bdellovibrio svalbardensis TaxID=2972972 RepID=A0ABT6DL52_9BACT|nr:hypothetical protein [Bdellovibrio svalbardensis]MDG0817247.1 hypothetical protein [Bdellovibrio svalbardensis]